MDIKEILSHVDHTLLDPSATWQDIKRLCDEGLEFNTASVCIPPSYVKMASDYLGGRLPVCTVIGFPNGYSTSAVKAFEAENAIANGAAEVDMVINIGLLKDKLYDKVLEDICYVRKASEGSILKVIIETCLLDMDEKLKMCEIVSRSGADFIKTSTGFSSGGATLDDVALLRSYCSPNVQVKASGGISSLEDAQRFLEAGATRLGTSRIVKLAKLSLNL